MSKESHWMMAIAFARRGYLVFNMNYRLAPKHAFPAAHEDVTDAYLWVLRNAEQFGGDLSRVVVAGESAGANLVTSLAIACCYARQEPWANKAFNAARPPDAVIASCGILQLSDVERFGRQKPMLKLVEDRLLDVRDGYIPTWQTERDAALELANPLLVLENGEPGLRVFPPVFASVGSADVLLDDSLRLGAALDKLGVENEVRVYDGENHAFQTMTWRRRAKLAWQDTFAFLNKHLASAPLKSSPQSFPPLRRAKSNWVKDRIIQALAA